MISQIVDVLKEKMLKTMDVLVEELGSVRVGRANPNMLDRVEVEYYGVMTRLNQLANISTPESRILMIQPWEKNILKDIEKAILKSDLGLMPNNDGSSIRLIIPEMTEETRRNTVKKAKKIAEDSKVALRALRRDANDKVKLLKKDGSITEDDLKKAEDDIQKQTDKFVKKVDEIVANKEKEIMSI
ncbi:Ribosome recycling factor [Candidatus Arthromitus sp. SFB-mouse-NL]|uniref:ribosome recycling factor n=1 Tax=Candidatus Arthromitus sp. SFB-mouse-NL TaxID=1508644 RepID=UPI00049AA2DE|nr:ribosome recycling factor [Candidatus Arthromitus sp. SFB-mouse-NL]AID44677.1 Ribosome recycling factor [Candidatus Arthromitus sp. SFB-mouse-NL]